MRVIKWSFGIIIVAIVVLALAPLASRFYAVHWLKEKGYQAQIDSARLNLLTGKLTIEGVDIRKGDQGISVQLLETFIKFPELFKKEFVMRRFRSQGVHLDLGNLNANPLHFIDPIESFFNRYMPTWRFDLVNGLSESSEICRLDKAVDGKAVSQCLSVAGMSLRDLTIQNTGRGWQLATRSTASLDSVYLKDRFSGATLLYLADAQIRDMVVDAEERRFGQIALKSLNLVERTAAATEQFGGLYQVQVDSLLMNDILETRSSDQVHLQLGLIDATSLRQTVYKNQDAVFVIVDRLREILPYLDKMLTEEAALQEKFMVDVAKIRIIDGGLDWLDESVSPPAIESLTGLSLELGPMSSSQPEKRSSLTLVARLDGSGEVFVKGEIAPFAEQLNYSLEGNINGLNLSKISAYTEKLLAEKVIRGRLDANFRADAQAAIVRGDAAVRLTDIATQGGSNSTSVLSLQNSFNKLKSKSESVDFDIYFEVDLGKVSSLSEALATQAKRTLSDLAKGIKPIQRKPKVEDKGLVFDSLKFSPDAIDLIGTQAIALKDIAILAQERPSKTLTICAITTGGEWAQLYRSGKPLKSSEKIPSVERQHLLDISLLRTKSISRRLLENGVNPNQIDACEPTIDLADTGPSYLSASLK
jgi:hypothetical protein